MSFPAAAVSTTFSRAADCAVGECRPIVLHSPPPPDDPTSPALGTGGVGFPPAPTSLPPATAAIGDTAYDELRAHTRAGLALDGWTDEGAATWTAL